MKKKLLLLMTIWTVIIGTISFVSGAVFFGQQSVPSLISPFIKSDDKDSHYLKKYTISALRDTTLVPSHIKIEKELSHSLLYYSFQFSYTPLQRRMTGQINLPTVITDTTPVIIMVRGYVPKTDYTTGVGTKNAAAAFAEKGYITISPDFFGYGESDPEPEDVWQARFEKPLVLLELLASIKENGIPLAADGDIHKPAQIGMWAHSNGGQIVLSALTISKLPIPTTLWAPVTAPFPYSILFFSDEDADEGRGARIWVNQLEKKYDLREFSFTNYLDGIQGPLQIHHGTADEAALKTWSDEFVQKVTQESKKREQPILVTYFQYPGADHNLAPKDNWNKAVQRDIVFFEKYLK